MNLLPDSVKTENNMKLCKEGLIYDLEKLGEHASSGSSRPEVFCKKGVLRNFTKFTGKHMCQSLFFNKVAGLRPATLLKKKTLAQVKTL